MSRALLILLAAEFAGACIAMTFAPDALCALMQIAALTPAGMCELLAVFSGIPLGLAAYFLRAALRGVDRAGALRLAACINAGFVGARLFAGVRLGFAEVGAMMNIALGVDAVLLGACVLCLAREITHAGTSGVPDGSTSRQATIPTIESVITATSAAHPK
jgi:hypothetical protein